MPLHISLTRKILLFVLKVGLLFAVIRLLVSCTVISLPLSHRYLPTLVTEYLPSLSVCLSVFFILNSCTAGIFYLVDRITSFIGFDLRLAVDFFFGVLLYFRILLSENNNSKNQFLSTIDFWAWTSKMNMFFFGLVWFL